MPAFPIDSNTLYEEKPSVSTTTGKYTSVNLHVYLAAHSISWVTLKPQSIDSSNRVKEGIANAHLLEVGRRNEELACRRKGIEAKHVEEHIASHGA